MKVAQFFKHMNISSNAIVTGTNVNKGHDYENRIFYSDIVNIPEWMKSAKLNSFTMKDNKLRIFYEL